MLPRPFTIEHVEWRGVDEAEVAWWFDDEGDDTVERSTVVSCTYAGRLSPGWGDTLYDVERLEGETPPDYIISAIAEEVASLADEHIRDVAEGMRS